MNKIIPFLWFDDNAEAAASFYLALFPHSRQLNELRANEAIAAMRDTSNMVTPPVDRPEHVEAG